MCGIGDMSPCSGGNAMSFWRKKYRKEEMCKCVNVIIFITSNRSNVQLKLFVKICM